VAGRVRVREIDDDEGHRLVRIVRRDSVRVLLREEGVTFQRLKTWKTSADPHHAVKKARIEHLSTVVAQDNIA
jgi:hypothetical protein